MIELRRAQWLGIVARCNEPLYVRLELADYLRATGDEYMSGLAAVLEDPRPRSAHGQKVWN